MRKKTKIDTIEDILDEACKKANKFGWKVDIVDVAIRKAFKLGKKVLYNYYFKDFKNPMISERNIPNT